MWLVRDKWMELLLHVAGSVVYLATALALGILGSVRLLLLFAASLTAYYLSDVYSLSRERGRLHALLTLLVGNLALSAVGVALFGAAPGFLLYGVQTLYQLAARLVVSLLLRRRREVIVLGGGARAETVARALNGRGRARCVARIQSPVASADSALLANASRATTVVTDLTDGDRAGSLHDLVALESRGVRVMDAVSFLEQLEGKVPLEAISAEWFLGGPGFSILRSGWVRRLKRVLDVAVAVAGLVVSAPLLLLCAAFTRLSSRGPVLFVQERTGRNGVPFGILKFRTMVVHDPGEHSRYPADRDPRITGIGSFMRRAHFDELPQLLNILRGDMSLIGPRAEWSVLAGEYASRIPYYDLRHAVRPGVTGWAQVCYRYGMSADDAAQKLRYDLYYLKHYSLFLDLVIAARTLKTVVLGWAQ